MASRPDEGMDAAMDAFADLPPIDEAPLRDRRPRDEADDDGGEPAVDESDQEEEVGDETGDEPADTDEEGDEPETAIDAPARWNADQKKVFASLPPEAQRVIAAQATEQERAIGRKAEEAASFRKNAEEIASAYQQAHTTYAQQLETYAATLAPQRPDFALLQTDPQAYAYQQAVYEHGVAQHQDLMQRSAQARQQAEAFQQHQDRQAAEEHQRILHTELGEEWSDNGKRQALLQTLEPVAAALGYSPEMQGQANATDILALRLAHGWKSKADKWDALQGSKMADVRAAKDKPARVATPGAAQPRGAARAQGLKDSMSRLRQSGDVRDAAAAIGKMFG